jgi:uncharacterized protein YcfJ
MALNTRMNVAIAAGVLLLGGIAAAAWMHRSENAPVAAAPLPYDASAVSASDGYYPSMPPPIYMRQQQAEAPPPAPVYAPGRTAYREEGRRRHHGRSKKHSVEIVAGTAAAGAAIGAIAGGGQGAAIGAVSGAGAGFAYDRLTHNH